MPAGSSAVAPLLVCLLVCGAGSAHAAESEPLPAPAPSASEPATATPASAAPPSAGSTPAAPALVTGSLEDAGPVTVNVLGWNVHWTNTNLQGLATVIQENSPDIVGLCEFTGSLPGMAAALSTATGRDFALQPGRGVWQGYGTDIFFDQGKWEALEGGVQKVSCPGTSGGDRAANWVVLRDLAHGKLIITGGVHLSYCAAGCDATHECELGILYNNLERMKSKYPSAAVVWMGDMNRAPFTAIVRNLMQGRIGSRAAFAVDDLVQAQGNTYFQAGTWPVDFIFGEAGKFERVSGGLTGQGVSGQHLSGADHFPVVAALRYGGPDRRLVASNGSPREPERAASLRGSPA